MINVKFSLSQTIVAFALTFRIGGSAFASGADIPSCRLAGNRNLSAAQIEEASKPVKATVREILESCPLASKFLQLIIATKNETLLDDQEVFVAAPSNEALDRFIGEYNPNEFVLDQFVKRQFAKLTDGGPYMQRNYRSSQSPTEFLSVCGSSMPYGTSVCDGQFVTGPLGGSSDFNSAPTRIPEPIRTPSGAYIDIVNGYHLFRRNN